MTVDVVYQGLPLVKGANARSEANGLFVELDAPMPVGTRLDLVTAEGTQSGRVESVVEGVGAGMLVGLGARKAAPEPNAPMAEMKSAPQPVAEKSAEKEEADDEPKPTDDGQKPPRKRRNTKKTVIGH